MNIPLEQLEHSKLIKLYTKVPYTSIYSDRLKNVPSYYNSHEIISQSSPPFTGFIPYKKIIFDLPDNNFLKNLQLKHTIVTTGNNTHLELLGINIIRNVRLIQKGREIATMNNTYLLNRIFSTPESLFKYYHSIHQPTPALNNTTSTFYTQIFLWPIENEIQNLLMSFHRDLQIEIELNNITFNNLTSYTCELCIQKKCYNDDFLNSYIQDVYPDKNGHRNYLVYDRRLLEKDVTNGSTQTEIIITQPLLAHSLHCAIFKTDTFGVVNINKIELWCGTTKMIDVSNSINGLSTLESLSNDLNNIL